MSFSANCSVAVVDLSPVKGCHKMENQLSSSLTSEVLTCTICNSTKECAQMRISKDYDLCLYLRVNTSFGFVHTCMEYSVRYKICEYSKLPVMFIYLTHLIDIPIIKTNEHGKITCTCIRVPAT